LSQPIVMLLSKVSVAFSCREACKYGAEPVVLMLGHCRYQTDWWHQRDQWYRKIDNIERL